MELTWDFSNPFRSPEWICSNLVVPPHKYYVSLYSDVLFSMEFSLQMMIFAWDGYAQFAWGANELRPSTKIGHSASIFGQSPLGLLVHWTASAPSVLCFLFASTSDRRNKKNVILEWGYLPILAIFFGGKRRTKLTIS